MSWSTGGRGAMTKTPITLQDLRRRLYVKAKAEPSWRFWGLYGHVCKRETLRAAYQLAKQNDGAPGTDGVTFEAIEVDGVECFLDQLREELVQRCYRPQRPRKVGIPKEGGKIRQLSIPSIRDRVVQGALKLILEPIFEADFQPGSYGYRPKQSAHAAVQRVSEAILLGKTYVIDLDLRSYFDTVRHHIVLEKIARRVCDDAVLWLLRVILKASGRQGVPQGGVITPRTQKVTSVDSGFIGADRRRRIAAVRRCRWNGDAVADHDRVIADEYLLDEQAHEALSLEDVQRVRRHPHPGEKRRERFCEAQIRRPLARLIGDRLPLGAQRLLALTQRRHPLAQLLKRQEVLLIGGQDPLDALAHAHQIALHRLFALFRGVGGARSGEPPIEFVLNQRRILEQPNDLGPDDLIQEILSHGSVVAARAAEVAPGIRANAAIVVDQPRTRTGRRARERVAASPAAHQPLHQARRNRASPRPDFVLVQQFLRAGKGGLVDEGRDRNLDPFLARSLMVGAVTSGHASARPQRARHPLAWGHVSLAEAGRASVRRVAQHRPDPTKYEKRRQHAVWCRGFSDRINPTGSADGFVANHKGLVSHWSDQEQAGVAGAPEATRRRLAKGNREYEARFGYIFIICATGLTAAEMLEALERRLRHAPDMEMRAAAEEQRKITRLRLAKLLDGDQDLKT